MFKSLTEPTHGSLHVRVAKKVTRHVGSLHIASFRCATEFGRHRGIADMAGLAAGLPRSRVTHFRPVGQFEQELPCVARFRACRSLDHFPSGFPLEGTRHEWWTNVHG